MAAPGDGLADARRRRFIVAVSRAAMAAGLLGGYGVFGSNYPMITPARALKGLGDLGLDDETVALFLGGNAVRVYGLAPTG